MNVSLNATVGTYNLFNTTRTTINYIFSNHPLTIHFPLFSSPPNQETNKGFNQSHPKTIINQPVTGTSCGCIVGSVMAYSEANTWGSDRETNQRDNFYQQ